MTVRLPGPLPDEVLPPYSGRESVCVKCSYIGAGTRYRAADEHAAERLERECLCCAYVWAEALATPNAINGSVRTDAGVMTTCPACGVPKFRGQYLCAACWGQLPTRARLALGRRGDLDAALDRLRQMYEQVGTGTPLREVRIVD